MDLLARAETFGFSVDRQLLAKETPKVFPDVGAFPRRRLILHNA